MNKQANPPSRFFNLQAFPFAIVVIALLVAGGYLLASLWTHGIGFPLDDAWIHQTYARNLAAGGEWSFVPGEPSGGSTAPLWSVLLAVGDLVNSGPFIWTFLLGISFLAATGFVGEKWFRGIRKDGGLKLPLVAFFLIGEWHLAWSAVSGMETILFAFLILAFFYCLGSGKKEWLVGLLVGVSIWVRPDGVSLLGPAVFLYALESGSWIDRARKIIRLSIPFLLLAGAYISFNLIISNTWLPNTFFAKQAEYAIAQQTPLLERIISLGILPLIGPGLLLIPGFVYFTWKIFQERNLANLGMILWWAGYILIYAIRLPVTYQHGRYLIPSMPVFFIVGLAGTMDLLQRLRGGPVGQQLTQNASRRLRRLGGFGWAAGIIILWIVMAVFGAFTYAQDVAIIDTEMVATSNWVAVNTPADAIIGAHDIGALGYFGGRRILDLAGLVSPEVIPFIRDETALDHYLTQNKAGYLMTFPDWYPQLVKGKPIIFQSGGSFSPGAGRRKYGDNTMAMIQIVTIFFNPYIVAPCYSILK